MSKDDERKVLRFDDLRGTGVLWAINKYLFHPRGFAVALYYDDPYQEGDAPTGWQLRGDGTEPWAFDEASDNEKFVLFESFIQKFNEFQRPKDD